MNLLKPARVGVFGGLAGGAADFRGGFADLRGGDDLVVVEPKRQADQHRRAERRAGRSTEKEGRKAFEPSPERARVRFPMLQNILGRFDGLAQSLGERGSARAGRSAGALQGELLVPPLGRGEDDRLGDPPRPPSGRHQVEPLGLKASLLDLLKQPPQAGVSPHIEQDRNQPFGPTAP